MASIGQNVRQRTERQMGPRAPEKVRQVGLELLVAVEQVARPAGIDPRVDEIAPIVDQQCGRTRARVPETSERSVADLSSVPSAEDTTITSNTAVRS